MCVKFWIKNHEIIVKKPCFESLHFDMIVKVEGGLISGVSGENPDFTIFKGVPYAAPPVGNLRWMPPQNVIPWEGVRECNKYSSMCYQPVQPDDSFYRKEFYYTPDPEQSEDCLYLNVWTPSKDGFGQYPVAIYIHGGAFDHGWGFENPFDGESFCRNGVILVTINYRLNVFGFLAHPLLESNPKTKNSSFVAIKDCMKAVRWVHDNISGFGGDPSKITLFGQSAGSFLTAILATNKEMEGLLNSIILQSFVSHQNQVFRFPSKKEALELGKKYWNHFMQQMSILSFLLIQKLY